MSRTYQTLGFWLYQELQPFIGVGKHDHKLKVPGGDTYQVKMSSTRLECFRRSPKCAACGLVGEFFALEFHVRDIGSVIKPHINLYGVGKGDLILMTQDHIIPQCLSEKRQGSKGFHQMDNLETNCEVCNTRKDCKLPKWVGGGLL